MGSLNMTQTDIGEYRAESNKPLSRTRRCSGCAKDRTQIGGRYLKQVASSRTRWICRFCVGAQEEAA